MSVYTKHTSADVDGGRQSGTENKPRPRTRLDFQMFTKKPSKSQNLKNAELVNRSFSALACEGAHRLAGNGELSATINRQNPIMGKSHKNVLPYGCVKTPHEAYIQIRFTAITGDSAT